MSKKRRTKSKNVNRNRNRGRSKEKVRFADGMRDAGKLASQLLDELEFIVSPGIDTAFIDHMVDRLTRDAGALSAPFHYGRPPFPAHCCTSINQVVCHGIPAPLVLEPGDIINVDVTPKLRGYHGDSSRMFVIGDVSPEAQKLVDVTKECLELGIAACTPGCGINVIGEAIEPHATANGFSVVKQFTGHGIGKKFHTDPPIPHMILKGAEGAGSTLENPVPIEFPKLNPGMAFTIEPMLNAGGWECEVLGDGWTVVTKDGSLSAQWEHTLLMTEDGVEVLTHVEG